jgi:hypothetical protein
MPAVQFHGRILPPLPSLKISVGGIWKDDDLDYSIDVFVRIENSFIVAECTVDDYQRFKITRILLRAIDTAQAIVDLAAFIIGGNFLVHFESILEPDGKLLPLKVGDADLAALCTTAAIGTQSFLDTLKILIEEKNLIPALRDLIDATSFPRKVVPQCAKAIETLRALMLPQGMDRQKGWPVMHENLRVTATYLKLITDESRSPRHGDHYAIPAEITDEIARRSWTIMNRYFEYRNGGSQPLPLERFPLLTG